MELFSETAKAVAIKPNNMNTTTQKQDAVNTVNQMLAEYGQPALLKSEIKDWGIDGTESIAQLQEYVNDFISELHTEISAEKFDSRHNSNFND